MKIIALDEIKKVIATIDLLSAMEEGFEAYSQGESVVPPVGELILPKGEVHIKSGFLRQGDFYVIKIASGFYGNSALGLPSGNGLMLLFSQETGIPCAALLDEGYLTDLRTAAAGAVAARYLAPTKIHRIGILGTGVQARLQLLMLKPLTDCRKVLVWGRGESQIGRYTGDMVAEGFEVQGTMSANELLAECNLVITTTPSQNPLLSADFLHPGLHITAVGSDTPDKQELDARILREADLIVADSLAQCQYRGEIHQAVAQGMIEAGQGVELGQIVAGRCRGRTDDAEITIADLTGVAVQDLKIAEAVYRALEPQEPF